MGRAMLIICAGTLISLGIISMSTSERGKSMTANAATYANQMTAKNAAHTAIQSAMQEINQEGQNEDGDWLWIENHGQGDEWEPTMNGAQIELHIEYIEKGEEYFDPDVIRMISKATYSSYESEVTSVYEVGPFSTLVPEFTSSMQFASNNFVPSFGGSASIHGNDESGKCSDSGIPENVPAVSVKGDIPDEKYGEIQDQYGNLKESSGGVEKVSDLDYEPTDELIERLENSGQATTITKDFKDQLGSAGDPGIFFVDEGANLTGKQSEGYGIMVVRSDATMQYDGELKVAGNFEFHGLVIFENAFDFVGRGTPTIYGSVLVGHTEEFIKDPTVSKEDKKLDVDLSGNINIQYDCQGQTYAKMAAADAEEQNRYLRVVTYE